MTETIHQENFTKPLFALLDEAFVTHHGIFLDKDTSLFETLATITAEQASIPVGGKCASLAAQVKHLTFYVDVLERYMLGENVGRVDWGEIWRTTEKVTPEEWDALRENAKNAHARLVEKMQAFKTWDNEDAIGAAMAIVVHTAYHLGEIRQALCILRPNV